MRSARLRLSRRAWHVASCSDRRGWEGIRFLFVLLSNRSLTPAAPPQPPRSATSSRRPTGGLLRRAAAGGRPSALRTHCSPLPQPGSGRMASSRPPGQEQWSCKEPRSAGLALQPPSGRGSDHQCTDREEHGGVRLGDGGVHEALAPLRVEALHADPDAEVPVG